MQNTNIENLSITPEILEISGYKKYNDSSISSLSYLGSWQKRMDNENGRMFFINFLFHDNHKYDELRSSPTRFSWEANMQFNDLEGMTINVSLFSSNKNIKEIEEFTYKMFRKMDFQYYEYDGFTGFTLEKHQQEVKIQERVEKLESQIAVKPHNSKGLKL